MYEEPAEDDGYRVLIDRLCPSGIKKEEAALNDWDKNTAPCTGLRKWFDHKADRFEEFGKKYEEELIQKKEELDRITIIARRTVVTLLMGAKHPKKNHAVVLKQISMKKS